MRWFDEQNALALRTARKPWKCKLNRQGRRGWDGGELPTGHTLEIPIGAKHVEYLGETLAFESGPRYCWACMQAWAGGKSA